MNLYKLLLFTIVYLQVITCALGNSNSNDPLQQEQKISIENKSTLFKSIFIFYKPGEYSPGKNDRILISKTISSLIEKTSVSFIISAYTDPTGSDRYNQQLSELRAEQVKKILLENGIPGTRIIIKALGETLSVNIDKTGYAKMRKVEITPIILMK
jgi:outer membrane protein OmpA-like peptidoglycan-associated protein